MHRLAVIACVIAVDSAGGHGLRSDRQRAAINQSQELQLDIDKGQFEDDFWPDKGGPPLCLPWSGGKCKMFACKPERGPTVCVEGKCLCRPGSCAVAEGKCLIGKTGTWLEDTYAIRFKNPYQLLEPYLGISTDITEGWITTANSERTLAHLASTASSQPQWQVAFTQNGNVRLRNTLIQVPNLMIIYHNPRRRRAFLQQTPANDEEFEQDHHASNTSAEMHKRSIARTGSARLANETGSKHNQSARIFRRTTANESEVSADALNRTKTNETESAKRANKSIDDNIDLWPIVVKLEEASPHESVFRIHPTLRDGPALEIWDPNEEVSLASADKEWWFEDEIAKKGICECGSPESGYGNCKGRQRLAFEPELPAKVVIAGPRNIITPIGVLTAWQAALIILICIGCCGWCIYLELTIRD